jgi:hypothetical protein
VANSTLAGSRLIGLSQATLSLRLPDNAHDYRYLDISPQRLGAGTAHSSDSILHACLRPDTRSPQPRTRHQSL